MEDKKTESPETEDVQKTIVMPLYLLSDHKKQLPAQIDEVTLKNNEDEITSLDESQDIQDMVVNEQVNIVPLDQKEICITQKEETKESTNDEKPTLEEKRKPKTTQTIEEKRKEQYKDALTLEEKRKKQFENKMTLEEKRALQAKGEFPKRNTSFLSRLFGKNK